MSYKFVFKQLKLYKISYIVKAKDIYMFEKLNRQQ